MKQCWDEASQYRLGKQAGDRLKEKYECCCFYTEQRGPWMEQSKQIPAVLSKKLTHPSTPPDPIFHSSLSFHHSPSSGVTATAATDPAEQPATNDCQNGARACTSPGLPFPSLPSAFRLANSGK